MKKHRILIVDDEVGVTRLLKLNLEATQRFEVKVVNDPREAVEIAVGFRPALILLDIMMPGLDGGEVAEQMQARPSLNDVPIVFLTAVARKDEVKERGGVIGGRPFIAKPVDMPELLARIEEHLAK
ncbi:MAG TPA: response regulator [Verrucomicrobiota bacterium]|nr:response regulator [Verrucomicrobiales bacterium]HRI12895.1 response regulator [Verrucomicrobiota bacterium]